MATPLVPTARPPRDRIVLAAAQLMRTEGVTGAALRDIVERSGAPWGSFRHYFPGGKEQLIAEAIRFAGEFAGSRVQKYLTGMKRPTPAGLFAVMAGEWRDLYVRAGFAEGCPLAAAAVDTAATSPALREALGQALNAWQGPLEEGLGTLGVAKRRRAPLALLMITGLEGALIVARGREDAGVIDTVIRELGPVLDAAVPSGKRP